MKKPRTLTPEELRIWRESNRHTDTFSAHVKEDAIAEALPASETPAARAAFIVAPRNTSPKTLSPLRPLAPREASKFFKPYGAVEAILDLHGLTKLEAYERVQQFIRHVSRAGKRHVTIITGKGRS